MTAQSDLMPKSIDQAIEECARYIDQNRRSANLILIVILQLAILALMGGAYLFIFRGAYLQTEKATGTSIAVYGLLVLTSVLIAVLVSLYKFHLSEIARTEHYKIGFLRIRIAANNYENGFASEVRKSLTDDAFSYEANKPQKSGKVESPIPGHPTSDLATMIVNKAFDGLELVMKPKSDKLDRDKA